MARAKNKHLRGGTEDVDVIPAGDMFEKIIGTRFPQEKGFTFEQAGEILQDAVDKRGWVLYSKHDVGSLGWEDGFDYKEAIEKARNAGADAVVVECLS